MREALTYTMKGDYLYPDLTLPETEPITLGRYGRMRKAFLKEHRSPTYNRLLLTGKLNEHLMEIERTAINRLEQLIDQMAEAENVNEELKEANQLAWVGQMNNIRQRAEEIILQELVFS